MNHSLLATSWVLPVHSERGVASPQSFFRVGDLAVYSLIWTLSILQTLLAMSSFTEVWMDRVVERVERCKTSSIEGTQEEAVFFFAWKTASRCITIDLMQLQSKRYRSIHGGGPFLVRYLSYSSRLFLLTQCNPFHPLRRSRSQYSRSI